MEFPPYTHVPGRTPHPINDPAGHSFGRLDPDSDYEPPTFASSIAAAPLNRGRDLFNAGYYWEAHEAWEAVWIAAGRTGPVADAVKSLIKLAAAGVKLYEGQPAGAQRHARRCLELLDALPPEQQVTLFGLPTDELKSLATQIAAQPPSCSGLSEGTPSPFIRLPVN